MGENVKVVMQVQEWRKVSGEDEEFGETLYVNGSPIELGMHGDEAMELILEVMKKAGVSYEMLTNLEELDENILHHNGERVEVLV